MDVKTENINIFEEYGNRLIEGIDRKDLDDAFNRPNENNLLTVSNQKRCLIHNPTGRKIILDCVYKYFEPEKKYYKLDDKSTCTFIRKAFDIQERYVDNCDICFAECLKNKNKIKKGRIIFSKDYFRK